MNSRYYRFRSRLFGSVPLLISAFMFSAQHVNAQTGDEGDDAPTINIAGDVYGGGKQGSVGVGNLIPSLIYTAAEAETENAKHLVKDSENSEPGADDYVTTYVEGYTPVSAGDAKQITKDDVDLNETARTAMFNNVHTTTVEINSGNVRTVFGGGENGRVFGLTHAQINGGEIGADKWNGTIHGGVFGAGDGASALVFGVSHVQIVGGTIYNNVYGGGNQADLIGSAATRLDGGTIYGSVFGSARMADVYGYTNVEIASDQANKTPLYVKAVFGGNDISGVTTKLNEMSAHMYSPSNPAWRYMGYAPSFIGKATTTVEGQPKWKPYNVITKESSYSFTGSITLNENGAMNVSVITSNTMVSHSVADKTVFIGTAFAGGNGEYTYSNKGTDGTGTVKLANYLVQQGDEWVLPGEDVEGAWSSFSGLKVPDTERAYLELEGGTFGYVYGGGNNATVSQVTDIYINNPDDPCRVPKDVIKRMGLQTSTYFWAKEDVDGKVTKVDTENEAQFATFPQTFDRVFGGNNLATMSIAPNWYLHEGRVNNLYGGGNKGAMTCENGILVYVFQNTDALNADGTVDASKANRMKINNLYAGCRMADVKPFVQSRIETPSPMGTTVITIDGDTDEQVTEIDGFTKFGHEFPANYASRVYVTGGSINNVYGGNDISGQVMVGADVEISGAISGDVYGGGNGAYPYTDNKTLAGEHPEEWGDYFYDKDGGLDFTKAVPANDAASSLAGLYKKRPHVENTLVHIAGEGQWIDPAEWENKINWKDNATMKRTAHPAAVKVAFQKNANGKWDEVLGTEDGMVLTKGEMEDINRVYVTGGVYCGGNSATVANPFASASVAASARATLKIGQCVTIDKVFLGSNGANMVTEDLLTKYAKGVVYEEGAVSSRVAEGTETGIKLAQFNLASEDAITVKISNADRNFANDMAAYMEGCAMNIMPAVEYVEDNKYTSENIEAYKNALNTADPKYQENLNSVNAAVVGEEIDVSVDPNADMDEAGLNFSARIGSFFVGGNVGSLTAAGTIGPEGADGKAALKFPRELVIYDKVVGGCNAANIPYRAGINAFYQGGLTGAPGTAIAQAGDNDPGLKLHLYIPCRMEPRVLSKETDDDGYVHVNMDDPEPWSAPTVISDYGIESDVVGPVQILDRGNIYGGCYESGYVNGSVLIEIKDELCATPQMRAYFGDKPLLGQQAGEDGTAAVVDNMRRYVLNHGWSAFGGGYGEQTEIWGNVYMNLSRNAGYINAYGGGQKGFIGKIARYTAKDITDGKVSVIRYKKNTNGELTLDKDGKPQTETVPISAVPGDYKIEEVTTTTTTTTTTTGGYPVAINKYVVEETGDNIKGGNTYVNLKNDIHRSPVSIFGLNAIYGGGYEGVVTGNTHVYAGGGLHYDIFGGASNADIYGATEVYVGRDRETVLAGTNGSNSDNLQIRHNIYGGNDFGGQVLGTLTHKTTFKNGEDDVNKEVTSNTYVKYYGGKIERSIFGGSCGLYRYDGKYQWTGTEGVDSVLIGEQWYKPEQTDGKWPELMLYPKNSTKLDTHGKKFADTWTTMPTLFNELTAKGTTTGYDQVAYNTFVDIDCQTDNIDNDVIFDNIYGGGYGMCDAVGRVDAHDTYVLLHSKQDKQYRLANRVFGGGYFSFVKNSTLDAVSGFYSGLYGGTFGTTVDAAVADSLNVMSKVDALSEKSQWNSSFLIDDYNTYQLLQEIDVTQLTVADYTSGSTNVNVYPALTANNGVDVYGAGAYTGADETRVTLYGGSVKDVYGGSHQEGVCGDTHVEVPAGSTIAMNALYGGSHGSYPALPCDVKNATINFLSDDAIVKSGKVFGGNNAFRATCNTFINYNAQAKTSTAANASYLNLYGAGNGSSTVAGYTRVNVGRDAIVNEVFGGGFAGKVFCKYDVLKDQLASGASKPTFPEFAAKGQTESDADFNARVEARQALWNYHDASGYARYKRHNIATVGDHKVHTENVYAHWYVSNSADKDHTNVTLIKGAKVMASVYGAGEGAASVVAGNANVNCYGAFVTGDIFGGGKHGNIRKMQATDTGYQQYDTEDVFVLDATTHERTVGEDGNYVLANETTAGHDDYIVTATVNMYGGNARDLFGGGYEGYVGEPYATIEETATDGTKTTVIDENQIANHDFTAVTTVNVGAKEVLGDYTYIPEGAEESVTLRPGEAGYVKTTITPPTADDKNYYSIPAINFSVYGAGDRGPVYGTSNVNMYNGYVGFDYRKYSEAEAEAKNAGLAESDPKRVNTSDNYYIDRVKSSEMAETDNMIEDGNLFGGGFGELAKTLNTNVKMYDGVIRNGLYGGGEVSSVGWGYVKDQVDATTGKKERVLDKVYEYGKTYVALYGGLVQADVFGGGRGWGYTIEGAMMNDETTYTDGYVFGHTDVNIFRGTVGTDYSLKDENGAHGNVFGGGNVGYVYGNSHKLTVAEKTAIDGMANVNKGLATTAGYYYRVAASGDASLPITTTVDGKSVTVNFAVDADGYMILSEDCRVSVKAYGMATDDLSGLPGYTLSYERGQKVPEEYVGLLSSYIKDGVVIGNIYTEGCDDGGEETIYFGGTLNADGTEAKDNAKVIATIQHISGDGKQTKHVHKAGERIDDSLEHLHCMNFLSHITIDNILTRDASVTISGSYAKGDYIPNEQLNQLQSPKDDASNWGKIDQSGIVIRNSIFAGGNVIKGSDKVYAFAKTVFGNATAALVDVFSCDLISVAGKGFGGLYGDGNLTFVDGYRELNITNYGTDFYNLNDKIGETGSFEDEYKKLNAREKDFYTIRYKCIAESGTTIGPEGKQVHYNKGDEIDQKIYEGLTDDQKNDWKATAAKINEGRTLNTVQRANYCGIKGSRIVLYGAIDRAQSMDEVDYTNYTINRVGELSLNRNYGTGHNLSADVHGSYFGIYNVVKLLGSMSSDYDFFAGLTKKPSHRTTQSTDAEGTGMKANISKDWFGLYQKTLSDGFPSDYDAAASIPYNAANRDVGSVKDYNPYSFFNWKADNAGKDERNDGTVANKVALASGVYLELVEDVNATTGVKNYGPVIGVVELDLLNVTPGEGGGYVYAENNHGIPHFSTEVSYATILADANQGLKTVRGYTYTPASGAGTLPDKEDADFNGIVTSGNFVSSTKTIIDDCFPAHGDLTQDCHYWYISGNIYVHEQLISAYTGGAGQYTADLTLPISLDNKMNANLRLVNILPGLYVNPTNLNYNGEKSDSIDITFAGAITKQYGQGDAISYWDWYNIQDQTLKNSFLITTYMCKEDVTIGEETFRKGQSISQTQYCNDVLGIPPTSFPTIPAGKEDIAAHFVPANEITKGTGYYLTMNMSNPEVWGDYYTKSITDGIESIKESEWNAISDAENKAAYKKDITFVCTEGGVYGRNDYAVDKVISQSEYDKQDRAFYILKDLTNAEWTEGSGTLISADDYDSQKKDTTLYKPASQMTMADYIQVPESLQSQIYVAIFEPTYVAKNSCAVGGTEYIAGASVNKYVYDNMTETEKGNFENAYICVDPISFSESEYYIRNQIIGQTEYDKVKAMTEYKNNFEAAFYCAKSGKWGGKKYVDGEVYTANDYDNLNADERKNFRFTYDALSLLEAYYYQSDVKGQSEEAQLTAMNTIGAGQNTALKYYDVLYGVTSEGMYADDPTDPVYGTQGRYSQYKLLDITATPTDKIEGGSDGFKYKPDSAATSKDVKTGSGTLTSAEYNSLPNDAKHFVKFSPKAEYKVTEGFTDGDKTYETGTILSLEQYQALSDINKAKAELNRNQYVVTNPFTKGNTYYALGQVVDAALATGNPNVTSITLPGDADTDKTYYVCFEQYVNGENNGHIDGTVESYTIGSGDSEIKTNEIVPVGTIIDETTHGKIPNYQKGFAISGVAPHEVTTLYVPKTADIENLQEDRYVTAIYEYQYDVDKDGQGTMERRIEKHVFNIRIQFMSGVPIVGHLDDPSIVLPSEKVGLRVPNVNEGAFPVLSGGWELYKTQAHADAHNDGMPYVNNGTPMYWYQDGYWVAYYAETSNGRAYSNPVQIKVANYHKLTDVVEDTKNHMYVNHKEVKRDPKIYIEDNNDLNNLNTLFQATTGDKTTTATGEGAFDQLAVEDRREGGVKDCSGLEFFVMNDIEQAVTTNEQKKNAEGLPLYTTATGGETTDAKESDGTDNTPIMVEVNVPWAPVGATKDASGNIVYPANPEDAECFEGNLHGNGHALTGMENSLFYKMCGNVYNLGVAGSFTGSGVADYGDGEAHNCWVWTTGTPAANTKAVMGESTKIYNCFYPSINNFDTGQATPRTVDDFVNGQVAYDLNRYYLVARYGMENTAPDISSPVTAYAFYRNADGTIAQATTGTDNSFPVRYKPEDAYFTAINGVSKLGYVEKYYEDGDFRYAEGLKPTNPDMRKTTHSDGPAYLPVYPDDYIFFGQKLSYGLYGETVAHNIFPVAAVKEKTHTNGNEIDNSENGLLVEDDATSNRSNRIYRAPAYFQNGEFGRSAIFNKKAAFAASVTYEDFTGMESADITSEKDKGILEANDFIKGCFTAEGQKTITFYPHQYMTAIDFTGSGDNTWTYENGFKLLLDFDYLDAIRTSGITQNLLAYVSGTTGTGHETANVVTSYFKDPNYAEYYDKVKTGYRTVGVAPTTNIKGHVVKAVPGTEGTVAYTATNDHLLVDKQDFNAPIAYTFASGKRMWYQRKPDKYATNMTTGWDAICLPFAAELVTTQQKGEITHFYGADGSDNDNSQTNKVGHEYWLREFNGKVSKSTETDDLEVASFASLAAGSNKKDYTNTFLWDYYYNVDGKDANADDYQTYYNKTNTYSDYPYNVAGTPYIIGLPGETYYEFDLSGKFAPANTSSTPEDETLLSAQTITFASNPGVTIAKSDVAEEGKVITNSGYSFTSTYLNKTREADGKAYYPMNTAGNAFDLQKDTEGNAIAYTSTAFRPYFVKTTSTSAKEVTRSIIFNSDDQAIEENPFDDRKGVDETNSMKIYVRGHKLVIESTYDATLNVYYINGQFVRKVDVKEGTNTYDGFRPGFYIVGNKKVNFAPGNY